MKTKVTSLLILLAFVGAGIFSFTHALDMAGGSHHSGDCPLVPGQEVVCSTSPINHLTLWQKATSINLEAFTTLFLLLSALGAVFFTYKFLFDNHSPPQPALIRITQANFQ